MEPDDELHPVYVMGLSARDGALVPAAYPHEYTVTFDIVKYLKGTGDYDGAYRFLANDKDIFQIIPENFDIKKTLPGLCIKDRYKDVDAKDKADTEFLRTALKGASGPNGDIFLQLAVLGVEND